MVITRAFAAAEAAEIVAAVAGSRAWREAGINADLDVDRAVRDAEILFEADAPVPIARCRDVLFAATRATAAAVAPKSVLAEVQIVRYRPGGRYVDHRDTPALGATPRRLSLVCYLNDDFTGGETAFTEPDVVVSPLTGAVVIFSPVLLHRARAVTAGTKYVVTAWYHAVPVEGGQ